MKWGGRPTFGQEDPVGPVLAKDELATEVNPDHSAAIMELETNYFPSLSSKPR